MSEPLPWYVALFLWLARSVYGTWSLIEVLWTAFAILGLLLNTAKLWITGGDLIAAYRSSRANARLRRQRIIVGWWVVNNAIVFQMMLTAFVFIGVVAGQLPSTPIDVGKADVPAGVLTGFALILSEMFVIAAIAFSLWARMEVDR